MSICLIVLNMVPKSLKKYERKENVEFPALAVCSHGQAFLIDIYNFP